MPALRLRRAQLSELADVVDLAAYFDLVLRRYRLPGPLVGVTIDRYRAAGVAEQIGVDVEVAFNAALQATSKQEVALRHRQAASRLASQQLAVGAHRIGLGVDFHFG